jgi:hypothetical protein
VNKFYSTQFRRERPTFYLCEIQMVVDGVCSAYEENGYH